MNRATERRTPYRSEVCKIILKRISISKDKRKRILRIGDEFFFYKTQQKLKPHRVLGLIGAETRQKNNGSNIVPNIVSSLIHRVETINLLNYYENYDDVRIT